MMKSVAGLEATAMMAVPRGSYCIKTVNFALTGILIAMMTFRGDIKVIIVMIPLATAMTVVGALATAVVEAVTVVGAIKSSPSIGHKTTSA